MATRWGVPCGCICVYDTNGDSNTMTAHEVKCELHKDIDLTDLMAVLVNWCKSQQGE